MTSKLTLGRAEHEASHAVIARSFGLGISRVSSRAKDAEVQCESAAYRAKQLGVLVTVRDYEKNAIVALAGRAANRRSRPSMIILDVIEVDPDNTDMINTRGAIYSALCLLDGKPIPSGAVIVTKDHAMETRMTEMYIRLLQETAAMVEQHWKAIERVAKHLLRYSPIDQAKVDELIAIAERKPI